MNASKPELIVVFCVVLGALVVSNFLFWGSIYCNGTNGHTKPESVWSLQQRIEAAQKEVDRICANPSNKEQIPDSFDRRLKAEPMAKVKALKVSISEMRQRLAGVEVAA